MQGRASATGSTGRNPVRKLHFTKAALTALKNPPSGDRYYLYDTKTPGLAICVTETARKSFYLYRRINGRPQRVRLGGFPELTVDQARREAAKLNGDIARGHDPQAQRRALAKECTLTELFHHYIEVHAKPHCKTRSWQEDQRRFDKFLGRWHARQINTITTSEIAGLHTRIGKKTPIEANRIQQLLSRLFNHARRQLAWSGDNPCNGVTKFRERSRDRFLDVGEMKRFMAALADEPNEDFRAFVLVSLLCGGRRSNVEGMRWNDLNLERGLWRVPEEQSKNREPMIVILPQAIVDLLRDRPARHAEFVFHDEEGRLPNIRKNWLHLREQAGLEDLWMHDLRRTLGSWQAAAGASLVVIGKSLGHKSQRSTAVYARLDLDPVRQSVETAATRMLEAGGVDLINGRSGK